MSDPEKDTFRFEVAFSFVGAHREIVRDIATRVAAVIGRDKVFFDEWYQAEILGPSMQLELRKIYLKQSLMVVIDASDAYDDSPWCLAELQAIETLWMERSTRGESERLRTIEAKFSALKNSDRLLISTGYLQYPPDYPSEKYGDFILDRLALLKERRGETPVALQRPAPPVVEDISYLEKYAPANLIGRETELAKLSSVWNRCAADEADCPRVLTITGMGGQGKSALVATWATRLKAEGWPGCERVLAWSFYMQGGSEIGESSADSFLKYALLFFGEQRLAHATLEQKGRRLAELMSGQRALLILDGLEPLQHPPTMQDKAGRLRDAGMAALLSGLAHAGKGLCIVTTRIAVADLKGLSETSVSDLQRLPTDKGVLLLNALGVTGPEPEIAALVEDVHGHALTLTLLGSFLKRAHAGDIGRLPAVKWAKADATETRIQAFRAMETYETWFLQSGEKGRQEVAILRLLGFFDRSAPKQSIQRLCSSILPGLNEPLMKLDEDDWSIAINDLEQSHLLTVTRDADGWNAIDAHPLLREYFAGKLKPDQKEKGRKLLAGEGAILEEKPEMKKPLGRPFPNRESFVVGTIGSFLGVLTISLMYPWLEQLIQGLPDSNPPKATPIPEKVSTSSSAPMKWEPVPESSSPEIAKISELAEISAAGRYRWRQRGVAPIGYTKGMAAAFALEYCNWKLKDPLTARMVSSTGSVNDSADALVWMEKNFTDAGMVSSASGEDTLRRLFVLLAGLGMKESSGRYTQGRDPSADLGDGENAEAGLFQTSYLNVRNHPDYKLLLDRYAESSALRALFQEGVKATDSDLKNYGSAPAFQFQEISKRCPAFSVECAALGLRSNYRSWGAVVRKDIEFVPEWDQLLRQVQDYVDELEKDDPGAILRLQSELMDTKPDPLSVFKASTSGEVWGLPSADKVNWVNFRESKGAFAIAMASLGKMKDRDFDRNWEEMKRENVIRGAYHVLQAGSPKAQAEFFFLTVGKLDAGDLPPVVYLGMSGFGMGFGAASEVSEEDLWPFMDEVERLFHRRPILWNFGLRNLSGHRDEGYPLCVEGTSAKSLRSPLDQLVFRKRDIHIPKELQDEYVSSGVMFFNGSEGDLKKFIVGSRRD